MKRAVKPAAAKTAKKKVAPRRAAKPAAARRTTQPPVVEAVAARIPRRLIFIDVENTSSEESLVEVLDDLRIDRTTHGTEVIAAGNWRAAGQKLGRRLASLGAQLVHSAPVTGVKDWSDLWIAVAAGVWLGQASPGDQLEIVSNDRAFDAVGDAAAARGVIYRRMLHRRGAAAPIADEERPPRSRSRGGRRRRGGRSLAERLGAPVAQTAAVAPPRPLPAPHAHPSAAPHVRHTPAPHVRHTPPPQPALGAAAIDEPHGASRDQLLALMGRLTAGYPGRWVNLDVLEKALKAEGFARPPGSPRLVTRLRNIKDFETDSHGRVRVVGDASTSAAASPAPAEAAAPAPAAESEPASADAAAPAKRRRRRRKPTDNAPSTAATEAAPAVEAAAPAAPAADKPKAPRRRAPARRRTAAAAEPTPQE